jgi:hypothetical protein
MKKVLLLGLVVMLVVVSLARIGNTAPVTAQEDDEEDELYGACAELTL